MTYSQNISSYFPAGRSTVGSAKILQKRRRSFGRENVKVKGIQKGVKKRGRSLRREYRTGEGVLEYWRN